jgi:3-ketosteroid 9alpha-monooxygenase subunit A
VYQLRKWYQQFYSDVAELSVELAEARTFAVRSVEPA